VKTVVALYRWLCCLTCILFLQLTRPLRYTPLSGTSQTVELETWGTAVKTNEHNSTRCSLAQYSTWSRLRDLDSHTQWQTPYWNTTTLLQNTNGRIRFTDYNTVLQVALADNLYTCRAQNSTHSKVCRILNMRWASRSNMLNVTLRLRYSEVINLRYRYLPSFTAYFRLTVVILVLFRVQKLEIAKNTAILLQNLLWKTIAVRIAVLFPLIIAIAIAILFASTANNPVDSHVDAVCLAAVLQTWLKLLIRVPLFACFVSLSELYNDWMDKYECILRIRKEVYTAVVRAGLCVRAGCGHTVRQCPIASYHAQHAINSRCSDALQRVLHKVISSLLLNEEFT